MHCPSLQYLPVVLTSVAFAACASSQSASQFPSNEALQKLAQKPAAVRPQQGELVDVEKWELTGPLPEQVNDEPAAGSGPASALLAELVKGRPGLLLASSSAECSARELGLFFAAKRASMTSSLEHFVAGRCGVTGTVQLSHGYRYQELRADSDEASLFAQLAPGLREDLQKRLSTLTGPHLIGLWFGKRDGLAVASWVVVPRQARIDAMAMVPGADGQIVVRGEMLSPADHVEALINRGRFGFRRCTVDTTVRMPQFKLSCEADPADTSTTIQVAAFEPGRVLGRTVLSLLCWPKAELGNHYQRPSLVEPSGATSGDIAADLAALVGNVRNLAGMKPLQVSRPESQTAQRLAPHYFAALAGLESELVADQVVLGLRAGWEVGTRLRVGQFTSGVSEGTVSAARLLSEVLESPGGREALLDPEVDHLAIGAVGSPTHGFVAAVFSTYASFELGDARGLADKVHRRLDELRAQKGLDRAEALPQLEADLATIARQVSSGTLDADQGLNRALAVAAERTHTAVRAHYVDAVDLDKLTIPDELIARSPLRVAIVVGQHQPSGDPWSRYLVYFIAIDRNDVVASL
jgi:hypothetical protein